MMTATKASVCNLLVGFAIWMLWQLRCAAAVHGRPLADDQEAALVQAISSHFQNREARAAAPVLDPAARKLLRRHRRSHARARSSSLADGPFARAILKKAAVMAGREAGVVPAGVNTSFVDNMQVGCPWGATVTAATYNIAFPDTNCVYQVMVYRLRPNKVVRISGRFPRVRYFSYQTYSLPSGQPLSSVIDYQIRPDQGINPYRRAPLHHLHNDHHHDGGSGGQSGSSSVWDRTGTYQIHVTGSGREGFVNELAAQGEEEEEGVQQESCATRVCLGLVILRLYTADPEENAFHSKRHPHHHDDEPTPPGTSTSTGSSSRAEADPRLWGYVAPPEVSVAFLPPPPDAMMMPMGPFRRHFSSASSSPPSFWRVPDCDPRVKTMTEAFLDYKVPSLQGKAWTGSPQDNEPDNFLVYTRDTAGDKALFANADASYLFATAWNRRYDEGLELVARIQARLPRVAHSLHRDPPLIGEPLTYDARYASVSTIALEGAAPVVDTLLDVTIEHKYQHDDQQQQQWGRQGGRAGGWDRRFSVVTGPDLSLLSRCPPAVYSPDTDLFLTSRNRQGSVPRYQGFLYRQILSRWQLLGEDGDRSVAWAKHVCSQMGPGSCRQREVFLQAMRSFYPRIRYYYCGYNLTAGCECFDAEDGKRVGWDQPQEGGDGRTHWLVGTEDEDQQPHQQPDHHKDQQQQPTVTAAPTTSIMPSPPPPSEQQPPGAQSHAEPSVPVPPPPQQPLLEEEQGRHPEAQQKQPALERGQQQEQDGGKTVGGPGASLPSASNTSSSSSSSSSSTAGGGAHGSV